MPENSNEELLSILEVVSSELSSIKSNQWNSVHDLFMVFYRYNPPVMFSKALQEPCQDGHLVTSFIIGINSDS